MGKKFDAVERYLAEAFKAFETLEYTKAEKMLDAAFSELKALGSASGVDLSGFEALWQAL